MIYKYIGPWIKIKTVATKAKAKIVPPHPYLGGAFAAGIEELEVRGALKGRRQSTAKCPKAPQLKQARSVEEAAGCLGGS